MIVLGDPSHREAIRKAANCQFHDTDPVIARVENGTLLGGSVFENFTGASIGIHVASFHPNWLSRALLYYTFAYPFIDLGVGRIFGQVPETNRAALRFNAKLGFEYVCRIEGVFPDGAMILMQMLPGHCRWLNIRPNEKMMMRKL